MTKLILAIAFVICLTVAASATTCGTTSVGGVSDGSGTNTVAAMTTCVPGTTSIVTDCQIYVVSVTGTVHVACGVYDSDGTGGRPNTAICGNTGIAVSTGWNVIPLSCPHLTSGHTYWIARNQDGSLNYAGVASGTLWFNSGTTCCTFPIVSFTNSVTDTESAYLDLTATSATSTCGYTTVGASSGASQNTIAAGGNTCTPAGTYSVIDAQIYLGDASHGGNLGAAIYDSDGAGGKPSTLLCQGTNQAGWANGWQGVGFTSCPSLTNAHKYYLARNISSTDAINSDATGTVYFYTSSCCTFSTFNASPSTGTATDSFYLDVTVTAPPPSSRHMSYVIADAPGGTFPAGPALTSITFGTPYKYNTGYPTKWVLSDTWGPTWADDGNIYTASDDTPNGWQGGGSSSNIMFSELSGYTSSLTGTLVNAMSQFGTETQTGCNGSGSFKTGGLLSDAGVLYLNVNCQGTTGAQTDGQLIKSSNHGTTWTPLPPSTAQNYASPMWTGPGKAGWWPLQYGQDAACGGEDGCSTYTYWYATDNLRDESSHLYLARVSHANIGALDATLWEYSTGANTWSSTIGSAVSLIDCTGCVSETGVQYLPHFGLYVMLEWYYTCKCTTGPYNDTTWAMYYAPHPWGPWTQFQTTRWNGLGLTTPQIISKSVSVDGGQTVTIATVGDFTNQDPATGTYTLIIVPATIP